MYKLGREGREDLEQWSRCFKAAYGIADGGTRCESIDEPLRQQKRISRNGHKSRERTYTKRSMNNGRQSDVKISGSIGIYVEARKNK
jgi:hypothetical protein